MAATRAERRLQELRLRGEPVRHRVPVLRHPAAQAGAEARAGRRRGPGPRGPRASAAAARPPSAARGSPTGSRARTSPLRPDRHDRGPGGLGDRCSSSSAPRTSRSTTSARSSARSADEWWRYLAAPFVYDDLGYLFACGLAIAIFLPAIERRLGTVADAAPGARLRRARDARRRRASTDASATGSRSPPAATGSRSASVARLARAPRRRAPRRPDRGVRPDRGRGGDRGAPAAAAGRGLRHLGRARRRRWSAPPAGSRGGARAARHRRWPMSKFTPLSDELHALHGRARRAPGRGPAPGPGGDRGDGRRSR